eukprot:2780537-Pyramimonas_sp.AAC.1
MTPRGPQESTNNSRARDAWCDHSWGPRTVLVASWGHPQGHETTPLGVKGGSNRPQQRSCEATWPILVRGLLGAVLGPSWSRLGPSWDRPSDREV